MNGTHYKGLLESALPSDRSRNWIFQHDGAPCHTSNVVTNWLRSKKIRFCENWPPYSPDLNPVENLWAIVSYEVRKGGPYNDESLKDEVEQQWRQIPDELIHSLIDSMPRRIASVIAAEGGHTKY